MKLTGIKSVEEVTFGVYVWQMPDGRYVADEDGNFLSISSIKDDQEMIKKLADTAKYYGIDEGKAVFLSGHRKISDEEYEEQLMRQKAGLVPDVNDIGAIKDEAEWLRKNGRR